jgi:hypothetical protein
MSQAALRFADSEGGATHKTLDLLRPHLIQAASERPIQVDRIR